MGKQIYGEQYGGHKPINLDGLKLTITIKQNYLIELKKHSGPSYCYAIFTLVCIVFPFCLYSSP
jgi:hypothetical protein